MAISAAALSACAATSSRSIPPTTITPTASSCGATKSNRLAQIDPLLGQVQADLHAPAHLSQDPLRDERGNPPRSHGQHPHRARLVAHGAGEAGQADRSAAPVPAHHVRSGNDEGDRLLPRHRELLAPFLRPPAGRSAAHAARLPAARFPHVPRREPPDRPAAPRHVSRRPLAQGGAGRRTASACPARSTTARSPSRNSSTASTRWSTFRPRPVLTS